MEPFTRLLFQDLSLEELYQEQGSMLHSLWISGKNNLEITMQDHHQCSGDYVNLTNPPFGMARAQVKKKKDFIVRVCGIHSWFEITRSLLLFVLLGS